MNLKKKYSLLKTKLKLALLRAGLKSHFNQKQVYILTSSPRSGSTMLSNALKAIHKSYVLFEPLQLNHVPEAKAAGFSWRTYAHPKSKWPKGKAFLENIFKGRIINAWTSKEISLGEVLNSNTMIIKFVRANRLLPWICSTFNVPKPILLLRHPCAVIASQIKSPDWNTVGRPDTPEFIENFPLFKLALLKTETVEEHLAAQWAMDQIPALMQSNTGNIIVITYEELLLYPKQTLSKIFNSWNLEIDINDALYRLKKPSSVVYKSGISGIDGWKKQLTIIQTKKVLNVVNSMGITFYNHELEANYDKLYNDNLSKQIQKAGNIN